jgi:hypothetical protein
MALQNPQPINIGGVLYNCYGFNVSLAAYPSDNKMAMAITAIFWPYRDTENGPEILNLPDELAHLKLPPTVYRDAQAAAVAGDLPLARFLTALEAITQTYINEKAGVI